MANESQRPVILTIAGSDSGGGAGIQTDLRTINFCGGYATSAITCLTSQNPDGVTFIEAVSSKSLQSQIHAVTDFFPVVAIKTGMLFNTELMTIVSKSLQDFQGIKVVDPVMIATSGARLVDTNAMHTMLSSILPYATWITPNLPEAEVLIGHSLTHKNTPTVARELAEKFKVNVILKGGHAHSERATDYVVCEGKYYQLSLPRIAIQPRASHGTGCTLSAALATHLARESSPLMAVVKAKQMVFNALQNAVQVAPETWQMFPSALPAPEIEIEEMTP